MRNKYLTYQREIVELFDDGNNYIEIARHLIDKYCLGVSVDYLRKEVKEIVHYTFDDKEIVEYNVRLSKQKQNLQDLNRISNKAFREQARIENALEEYNKELIKLLKSESLSVKIKKHKGETKASLLIQIADTHFNELVSIETNSYDFKIASKRLQKYAYHIKQYIGLYNIKEALVCITGDLLNSDRRLDELVSASTNRSAATFLGVHLLRSFLVDLNDVCNLSVCCVTGNESRLKEEMGWVDIVASDNYDFTIFEMLRLLLPDINFIRGGALEMVVEIGKQKILVIHGHQLGKMTANDVGKVLAKYSLKGVHIDLIICGHLHETMIRDNIARSASLVGANAYSDRSLQLASRASQNIYIFTDDGKHSIAIDLQETDKYEGYDINKELAAYNAKSLEKTLEKKTIYKIII